VKVITREHSSRRSVQGELTRDFSDFGIAGEAKSCKWAILERILHPVMARADSEAEWQSSCHGGGAKFTRGSRNEPYGGIMKRQTSFATLRNFCCPICGATQSGRTSAAHNSSFACTRCHTVLEVTTSRSLTVLSASIVMSLSLSIATGLQGPSFALALVAAAAVFNWFGQSMRKLVAAPELRVRPNAHDKSLPTNVLTAHRPDQPRRTTHRHESLQCPLVVTRDWK
jgi:hypothetical protein